MKKKESVVNKIPSLLKERGQRMDWFLKEVGMSRVHFYLIRKGERPLTDQKREKINEVLKLEL